MMHLSEPLINTPAGDPSLTLPQVTPHSHSYRFEPIYKLGSGEMKLDDFCSFLASQPILLIKPRVPARDPASN